MTSTEIKNATREELLSRSGLDFMRAILNGELPPPPMAQTLGYRVTHVAAGEVVFAGAPGMAHTNPMGGVHGGWYGTVLDSAMGCAVMTAVPRGALYTTLEYKINITRALPPGTAIRCTGRVDHAGRSTAVARGELRGADDDRLYATGSTTCMILSA
jgi:uncharacterized protein (TIGR00369 family)